MGLFSKAKATIKSTVKKVVSKVTSKSSSSSKSSYSAPKSSTSSSSSSSKKKSSSSSGSSSSYTKPKVTIIPTPASYKSTPIQSGVTSSHGTGIKVTVQKQEPVMIKHTVTAPAPTMGLTVPTVETIKKLQPTKTLIQPKVEVVQTEEKGFLGRLAANVVDKVQDTKLYQSVESKVVPIVKVVAKTTPVVAGVSLASKIVGNIQDKKTSSSSSRSSSNKVTGGVVVPIPVVPNVIDLTTQRKQDLLAAKISGLDKSITGRDYEKEKALALERDKLNQSIKKEYPGMPGGAAGLNLINPALGIQGTKEKALNVYDQAVADEQTKVDLQNKISGAPTPFEKYAYETQLQKLENVQKAEDIANYNALKVEAPEKSKWFVGGSKALNREKDDLSNLYEGERDELQKDMKLIELGASFKAKDLSKDILKYEEQVTDVNQKTNVFNQKEKEFMLLKSNYDKAENSYLDSVTKLEKLKETLEASPSYENQTKYNIAYAQLETKYDITNDIFNDYKTYGEQLQRESKVLGIQLNEVNAFKSEIEKQQQGLNLAENVYTDKAANINRLTGVYSQSLENIDMKDTFRKKKAEYQESIDYFKDVQTGGWLKGNAVDEETGMAINQVSKVGKTLGKGMAWVGKVGVGIASSARNIPEFVAVAPVREMKEDIAAGTFKSNVTGIGDTTPGPVGLGQYWAKGVYDWEDPENKNYNWKTNVNWQAAEGALDLALLGISAAKPIASGGKAVGKSLTKEAVKTSFKAATASGLGKFAKRLGVSVIGSAVGTGAFKTGGYAKATEEERKFIDSGTQFQGAMQAGFKAEESHVAGKIPFVGRTLYNWPGAPLVAGAGKDFSKSEMAFYTAVDEYYKGQGLTGVDLQNATIAAMRMRKAGASGEVAGTLSANVMSEIWGQKMLSEAGANIVAGKGTFWKPAFQIGKAGFMEGVSGELSTQMGRYEDISVGKMAFAGGAGFVTAGLLGGTIAKLSGKPGGKILSGAANVLDPYEKPGDILAGMFEKGAKKAAARALRKTVTKAPVITVVPNFAVGANVMNIGAKTTSISNTMGTQQVALTPSQQMSLLSLQSKTNIPSNIFIPKQAPIAINFGYPSGRGKVPTPTEALTSLVTKKPSVKVSVGSYTEVPQYSTTPTTASTIVPSDPFSLTVPSWTSAWVPAVTPVNENTYNPSNTPVNPVVPVTTITNVFSTTFAPTKTVTKAKIGGAGALGPAWWLAQQQDKAGFGWVVENKISDFAGDFMKKQTAKRTSLPKATKTSSSMTKKINSMI